MNDDAYDPAAARREIANRDRRRALESRSYQLTLATIGILAYSTFGCVMTGLGLLAQRQPIPLVIITAIGALYVFALYRTWAADDRRIWVTAVPATITVLLVLTDYALGARPSPVPLLLNLVLLGLIPWRRQVAAQLQALKPPTVAAPADAAAAGAGKAES
ncbi:hypothetical protein [Tahibacter caeni]|uniref:hypothetical protein n=1 Tax=Tahibacter caeni TaxID=1453545 RepID=UPI002148CE94|nr:hypothetical protein [Tahibacter caeni]